jgi:hypothetical protein
MPSAIRAFAASTLLLAACGDDTSEPASTRTFNGQMTGAYVGTLTGEAEFGIVRDNAQTGFALVLGDGGTSRIVLRAGDTPRPAPGTYEIVAPGSPRSGVTFEGDVGYVTGGALNEFEIRGGTLTITESRSASLVGSFELRAERTSPCCDPAPVEIVVTGTFDAAPIRSF